MGFITAVWKRVPRVEEGGVGVGWVGGGETELGEGGGGCVAIKQLAWWVYWC